MYKLMLLSIASLLFYSCLQKRSGENFIDSASVNTDTVVKHNDRVNGAAGTLYVNDGGTGGVAVLFAHSFGGDHRHWKNQLEHLRKTRRAVAFDFRGHGKSDPPSDNNYSAEALAEDIAAVADSLHLDRFILVGHSMGGAAAISYAGSHPERLSGLVLEGTPGKSDDQQAKAVIASLESDRYHQVMNDYRKQLLTDASPTVDSMVNQGITKLSKPASVALIKAIFAFNPLPELIKYNGPRLILSTQREDELPNSLHHQSPEIPRKMFEGTSHWIQLDKPDEFNQALDEFIKSIVGKLTL